MDDCKHYLNKISRPFHVPGMPLFSTTRQDISVNLPRYKPSNGLISVLFPNYTGYCIILAKLINEHYQSETSGLKFPILVE